MKINNNHKSCKWTRTQNHLVRKQILNHLAKLAKWLSGRLRTKWFWVPVQLLSLKLQISCLLWARISLTFRQLQSMDSLWNAYVTWQEHTVKCTVQISTQSTAQSFSQFGQMVECLFTNYVVLGSSPVVVT